MNFIYKYFFFTIYSIGKSCILINTRKSFKVSYFYHKYYLLENCENKLTKVSFFLFHSGKI